MKKFVAVVVGVVGLLSVSTSLQASVTIEIDAGILRNATGTATVPVGGLLQLIASPVNVAADGVFTPPTSTSFVTGSDILVASFPMNYGNGAGETDSVVPFNLPTSAVQIPQGDALLLRWYPTLTTASTTPGIGATYGQYRSDTGETEGGMKWFVPADGTYNFPNGLNFNTMAAGGANPETTGFASNIVLLAGVPEPSTYAMVAVGLVGLVSLRLRERHNGAGATF